ncbi:MAG: hypothetical protein EXR47_04630 [Dehalococcoidia bacterium]|nr:hypothetical protein [Dehalococcoidia bacterium]
MGAVAPIAIAVGVVIALVVGISYVVMRSRSGESLQVSLRLPLRLYLLAGVIAGLVLLTIGAAGLVRAGLGYGLDKEFSYYPVYFPSAPLRVPEPVAPPPQKEMPLASPTLEEERETRAKGLDRAAQEGLLKGISYTLVGAVILGVHVLARRRLETAEEREGSLSRGYLVLVAAIFFIIVLVNLPQAIFGLVRFYVLEPLSEFDGRRPPGENLAFAVAALPAWVTYLLGAVRAVRKGGAG